MGRRPAFWWLMDWLLHSSHHSLELTSIPTILAFCLFMLCMFVVFSFCVSCLKLKDIRFFLSKFTRRTGDSTCRILGRGNQAITGRSKAAGGFRGSEVGVGAGGGQTSFTPLPPPLLSKKATLAQYIRFFVLSSQRRNALVPLMENSLNNVAHMRLCSSLFWLS